MVRVLANLFKHTAFSYAVFKLSGICVSLFAHRHGSVKWFGVGYFILLHNVLTLVHTCIYMQLHVVKPRQERIKVSQLQLAIPNSQFHHPCLSQVSPTCCGMLDAYPRYMYIHGTGILV